MILEAALALALVDLFQPGPPLVHTGLVTALATGTLFSPRQCFRILINRFQRRTVYRQVVEPGSCTGRYVILLDSLT